MAAKPPAGGLLGVLQAALHAGLAEGVKQEAASIAAEYGEGHILSHIARGVSQYQGRKAETLAREHGYDYQSQQAPPHYRQQPPRVEAWQPEPGQPDPFRPALPAAQRPATREQSADELWTAGRTAKSRGDHTQALGYLTGAAEKGHARSMGMLANYYEQGEHVDRSLRKAAIWYHRAAEAGDTREAPDALNRIGGAYQNGQGVTRDLQAAFRLYVIAAKAGNMHAQYNAGWYLWRGYGGQTQDLAEARRLFQLSAAQGYAEAREALSKMDAEAGQGPRQQGGGEPQRPTGRMSGAEARQWLALGQSFTRAELDAAYKRVMLRVHPDAGGNDFLAQKANEAREVLANEAR